MGKLRQLKADGEITTRQYNTYKGQVSRDEIGCIKRLNKRLLISDEEADALILECKLAYTE